MFFHQNKNIEFQYKSFNFHLINLDIYVYHTIIITIILQNFYYFFSKNNQNFIETNTL